MEAVLLRFHQMVFMLLPEIVNVLTMPLLRSKNQNDTYMNLKFYPSVDNFTPALLVTNIMSVRTVRNLTWQLFQSWLLHCPTLRWPHQSWCWCQVSRLQCSSQLMIKKIRHFLIFGSWLTVACVRHEIFPIPIKPVVSPPLAPHFPLPLKACWSDRSDTKR